MKFVWFVHAIASCWNNGNAHFLRGLARSLTEKGHEVVFYEPRASWSETNLITDHGTQPLEDFAKYFPAMARHYYDVREADPAELTDGADVVIMHEWNDPEWIRRVGELSRKFTLLFHDTHHRAVTDPDAAMWDEISDYDGVLAFGGAIAEVYRRKGWNQRVFTLHEAADTTLFRPVACDGPKRDLIWIGNWGDEERSAELREFLIEPATELGLSTSLCGVRYPAEVVAGLGERGLDYRGWLPNHAAPRAFSRHHFTMHVPRGPYARQLPGIPTIRVFEALACGIPLISSPWEDSEGLFPRGCYLTARNGDEMKKHILTVLHDEALRTDMVARGLAAIESRHTCAHRSDELVTICQQLARGDLQQCA